MYSAHRVTTYPLDIKKNIELAKDFYYLACYFELLKKKSYY